MGGAPMGGTPGILLGSPAGTPGGRPTETPSGTHTSLTSGKHTGTPGGRPTGKGDGNHDDGGTPGKRNGAGNPPASGPGSSQTLKDLHNVRVTARDRLNIRSTPGVGKGNKIGAVAYGTVLQATGKTQKVDGILWEQVRIGGKTAWADGDWLAGARAPVGGGRLPSSVPYSRWINQAAAKYGIDPALVAAVIKQESDFDPKAVSSAGAIGLGQLMPATARELGVDPWNPQQNIDGTAHYLANMLQTFGGNVTLAIAVYNAGPGAVEQYHGVPPHAQTQQYVQLVLSNYHQYRGLEQA